MREVTIKVFENNPKQSPLIVDVVFTAQPHHCQNSVGKFSVAVFGKLLKTLQKLHQIEFAVLQCLSRFIAICLE